MIYYSPLHLIYIINNLNDLFIEACHYQTFTIAPKLEYYMYTICPCDRQETESICYHFQRMIKAHQHKIIWHKAFLDHKIVN